MSGSLRENVGKKDAKQQRASGMIPCVMYGQGTQKHILIHENDFKNLKEIIQPFLQGKSNIINEYKVEDLLSQAQEDEKVLFVFLKKYDSLTQAQGECIAQFFKGLKNKWYDFMYEIEKLPSKERQAYADKRFNQAKEGLANKCPDLMKKKPKQAPKQQVEDTQNYSEIQEEEEEYYF